MNFMVKIEIKRNEAGQRLDRFMKKYLVNAPLSYIYKSIRKDVKVNGKRRTQESVLEEGDVVSLYLSDEEIERLTAKPAHRKVKRQFHIAYEDDNIIAVEKPYGLLTHGDRTEKKNHLANQVVDYLIDTGAYNPRAEKTFVPAPVNRLDRNTTGLVLFGKKTRRLTDKKTFFAASGFSWLDAGALFYLLFNVLSFLGSDFKKDAWEGVGGWNMGLRTQLFLAAAYFLISRFFPMRRLRLVEAGAMLAGFRPSYMDQITCWELAERELAGFGEEAQEKVRLCLFQAALLVAGKLAQTEKRQTEEYGEFGKSCLYAAKKAWEQLGRRGRRKLPAGYRVKGTVFLCMPKIYLRLYQIWKRRGMP